MTVTTLPLAGGDRARRDRLELLTALINGPSFDPLYRAEVIRIPRDHPVFPWGCVAGRCERARAPSSDLCETHTRLWRKARAAGTGKAAFLETAPALELTARVEELPCRVCPERTAASLRLQLCCRHLRQWSDHQKASGGDPGFDQWLARQAPIAGYGSCQVRVCSCPATSPLGLCTWHEASYKRQHRPGGASLPPAWPRRFELAGLPVPVSYRDEARFLDWRARETAICWPGQVNLRGLRPLLQAEIQWGLFAFGRERRGAWDLAWVCKLAEICRARDLGSLTDLDPAEFPRSGGMAPAMLHQLRLIYDTPADARHAGFLETEHFGVRFPSRASRIDLTEVSQRWLRDLLWDHLAALLQSASCPRTAVPVDYLRLACAELSAFLQADAPGGGHDPAVLRAGHAQRFVADQRHRARNGLASLAARGSRGATPAVTTTVMSRTLNGARRLLRDAMDTGAADRLGLDREFIVAIPAAGATPGRTRRPFPDEVARALAGEANLADLAAIYDPADEGLRDMWEAIVTTGRRVGEVLRLRVDCTGRYGGLPVFWHDQTKVGNLDAAIRIPEWLLLVLENRQRKTIARFAAQHGRPPAAREQARLALFPSPRRNADGTTALSYGWFWRRFRGWVDALDLGHYVAHQARHTLATSLLRNGATLTHVRRYLGHVSDRMAEHYIHLTSSDLNDVLHHVWVAGPGAANPGELLAGGTAPMTAAHAYALAIDLSQRSTPAEGGFCTFQPVVDGGACPWNLNCHSCDKFVLSGADLLYWRRKREQWYSIAERAPDDATASYLHQVFAPTAAAIDGLEAALAGLGLLEQALALDLRRPQDYFQRIWSLGFRAAGLADAAAGGPAGPTGDIGEQDAGAPEDLEAAG